MVRRFVIVPAGGIGSRMGLPYPKQLLPFRSGTLLEHTCALFGDLPVYVPVPEGFRDLFEEKLAGRAAILLGGATRFDSVRRAFQAIDRDHGLDDADLVLIHDAARPFLDPQSLEAAWRQTAECGALIYACAAVDTMKRVDGDGRIRETLDRRFVHHAQTPQIFRAGILRTAYRHFDRHPDSPPTDEARLVEMANIPVKVFPSSHANRKITNPEDLTLIEQASQKDARPAPSPDRGPQMPFRIGHGYDVHRFDPDRPLYLGGILIPGGPGLLGHSDADVAIHALIDAMLGAAGRGDIGHWFPDDDPGFANIRSTLLLEKVWADLRGAGYAVANVDITIQAQVPKLAPYIAEMRACLAGILGVEPERVNIKATTTEGLGFVGTKQGMAADAVALLVRVPKETDSP
ncbi:Bifunctional enzyme IspD/IspF [Sulfidibacter corallicola]|uniref:Bifunctional enzyme IspD/IspF n=1 Tax=Sulfidibacter corallicola TaxID=2818388 RepID=A0A8A4TYS9_SULCO|nr:2-C-methyl-D-erythritol 2,4-cyclodiphosphate synthase [Sulfidibacter corallicola]QTD54102.1 2-C-methyl-D-erythritol 2,4-cyclodiphosphate synthase [Sulfidibacter corallicola]